MCDNHRRGLKPHFSSGCALWLVFLTLCLIALPHYPTSAANGAIDRIVYRVGGGLWTINAEGRNPQPLGVGGSHPNWSPDGRQIVFDRQRNFVVHFFHREISVVNADGSGLRSITEIAPDAKRPIWDEYPAWSPDGQWIAFHSNRTEGDRDIYIIDISGNNLTNLTNSPETLEVTPAWSPDGETIVYTRGGHLVTIHLADRQQTQITDVSRRRIRPIWSPDGMQIAFFSKIKEENWDIGVMDADGKNERRLTRHPASDTHPTWSPDGTQIAFHSNRDNPGRFRIYRLTLATGEIMQLTDGPLSQTFPDWSPISCPRTVRPMGKKLIRWGELKTTVACACVSP